MVMASICGFMVLLITLSSFNVMSLSNDSDDYNASTELLTESSIYYIHSLPDMQLGDQEARRSHKNISAVDDGANDSKLKNKRRKNSALYEAIQSASFQGLQAMIDLYERKEPEILRKGEFLETSHPAAQLSLFSAPMSNASDADTRAAYASLYAAKKLQESLDWDFTGLGRQATKKKISLKKTPLEGFCPPRELPQCVPATKRYRTHDGTCNNFRKPRWGSAHMPFHRFLSPEYSDGLEAVRISITGEPLPSARFVSLVVHGYRDEEAPVTMLLAQWGQFIDHDITATLQPRSINGSIPSCCRSQEPHPSCLSIKVPRDDPFLAKLGVRCLEFLRSAPAQRRDCLLSWREQTNQATSFIDASPVYSSNPRTADNSRIQRDGLLLFGRGPPREDPCLRGGFGHQCIRAGDTRAGEQPGLLAIHTVFVAEHNRITLELADLNPHWSDEKLYQETRRIIGAMFQHITYREFLPMVVGREVMRLFDIELLASGFYEKYDPKVNPSIANSFSTAAFRFGHALVQGSILRSDASFRFLNNNVSLHEENSHGDIGTQGSLHRIIRGMATQRTLKRDEFMSPELTNHLFQSGSFPFGMDLAAINIQRGRDHGLPSYVDWRKPCGLSSIRTWEDLEIVAGTNSAQRMRKAYNHVEDIDLFVGGICERPVVGGLVGPTFACIIAQQFSNLRKGDRFWYENVGFESSFTPSQLATLREVSFSQILCRSMGSTNFLQPHAFLPPDFHGNERQRCGVGVLTPIELSAWLERDPFHKENDFAASNFVQPNDDVLVMIGSGTFENHVTSRPVANNFDFDTLVTTTKRPTITKRPSTSSKRTTSNKNKTTVDNKLDFSTTTSRPKRKRSTVKTPNPTVDNKLDFTVELTTKRPDSPFSKLGKANLNETLTNGNDLTTKRSNDKRQKKPKDTAERRIDNDYEEIKDTSSEITDNSTIRLFKNEDNATKYYLNKPVTIRARLDDTESKSNDPESRLSSGHLGNIKQYYDNNFDYHRQKQNYYTYPQRPGSYYPIYPPLTQLTSKRPLSYQNNRPSYQAPNNVDRLNDDRQTNSPISNKYSTPFSYDASSSNSGGSLSSVSPQINYDNMAIPLYISPNRVSNKPIYNRPTYATTRKLDLSTFLIVETTRRTTLGPNYINIIPTTKKPNFSDNYGHYQLLHSTSSQILIPSLSFTSIDTSYDSDDDSETNIFPFISSTNKHSTKVPIHDYPKPFSDSKPSFYTDGTSDENEDFDGYLRPETTFYVPLGNEQKIAYNDYTKLNKPETTTSKVKYFYMENVLHKVTQNSNQDQGLYGRHQTKRYAPIYDKSFNENIDDFVSLTRTLTDENFDKSTDDKDNDLTRTISLEGRSKNAPQNIFLVPFKVLTRPERPDNWINVGEINSNNKTKLPDVPALLQDDVHFTKELPKPQFGSL